MQILRGENVVLIGSLRTRELKGMVQVGVDEIKRMKREEMEQPITQSDFMEALQRVQSSVGKNDLDRYDKWMQEFGSS